MLPPAVDEAAASSGLRSSVRRRLGLHQHLFGVFYGFVLLGCQSDPHESAGVFSVKIQQQLLVGDDSSGSCAVKELSLEAL